MATLAGEAAVRIVPTLKNFHSEVNRGLKRQPHSLEVKINPDFSQANAEMAAWRARQKAEGMSLPVRADFNSFRRDLSQVEHIFKRNSVAQALRINIAVIGLDALPALAYAAGSAASGLDALGKSALALPGVLAGALASAGALATGLKGVSDALKAYDTDAQNAADTARKQQEADRGLVSAKRNLQNAIRDQRREIEDLNSEMRRTSLNEADAVLSIQEDIERLRKGGFKSITEFQRAQLSLAQDLDHLSEVRRRNTRTIEDANKANAEGITGSDRVADALDRVAKATESINQSNVSKVSEALAKLSPNAQAAVKELHGFTEGFKKVVQAPVQDNLFQGMDQSIRNLHSMLPGLSAGLSGVAQGLNANIRGIFDSLPSNQGLLDRIFGNTQGGLLNASKGMGALSNSLLQLSATSSNVLPRLGDAAAKVFDKFDGWVNRISADGSLTRWIDQGLNALTALGHSLGNVASIVSSIGQAFNAASGTEGGFIGSLERVTDKWSEFLKSTKGQSELIQYFKQAKGLMSDLGKAFKDAKPLIHDVVQVARDFGREFLEIAGTLASVAGWIERNTGLLKPMLEAYLAFKTVKPIIEGLTGAWTNYSKVMTAVSNQGGVFNALGGGYTHVKEKAASLGKTAEEVAQKAAGGGKTSLLSALKNVGAFIGPGAVFAGALIGATTAVEQLGKAHEKAGQQAAEQAAQLDRLKGSLDSVTGAATTAAGGETAKSFEDFMIPGIGRVNVNEASRKLGMNPGDIVRAASDPSAQGLRNDLQSRLDQQTARDLQNTPAYKDHADEFNRAGLDPLTIAKAIRGEPGAKAKFDAVMARSGSGVGGAQTNILGGIASAISDDPNDMWHTLARTGSAGRLPTLTDLMQAVGAPGQVGFALGTTSSAIGDQSRMLGNAAVVAQGGNFGLSPAGTSGLGRFQPDPIVRLDPASQRPVVRLNRAPTQAEADELAKQGVEIGSPLQGGGVLVTLPKDSNLIQKFAGGGLVGGIGGPTDDLNLVRTSPGEHITKAKAVSHYGVKLFDDLNNMRIPKREGGGFLGGGWWSPPPRPVAPFPMTPLAPRFGNNSLAPMDVAPALPAPSPNPTPVLSTGVPLFGQGPRPTDTRALPPTLQSVAEGREPTYTRGPHIGYNEGVKVSPEGGLRPTSLGSHAFSSAVPGKPSVKAGTTVGLGFPVTPKPPPTVTTTGGGPLPVGKGPGINGTYPLPKPDANGYVPTVWDYTTGQDFTPGHGVRPGSVPAPKGVSPQPLSTKVAPPYTQSPVRGGVPAPATPLYTAIPGPRGPVIAPNGPVMGRMRAVIDSLVGTPYVWGGWSPNGVDCSGLASIAANIASGRDPWSSRFATGTEGAELSARGFLPGKGGPGTLTIGWNGSHTAITLPDGTSVSSGENGGVQYGGGGANQNQFTDWMYLPVDDSVFEGALGGLGVPGIDGGLGLLGSQGIPGLPNFLQPQSIMNFLGSQAQNVGQGISGIGMQLFSGLTGINLGPLMNVGQQAGNGLISQLGGSGSSSGGSELNDIAGMDIDSFLSGNGLPVLGSAGSAGSSWNPSGGAEQWRPLVRNILQTVGPKYGISNIQAWEDAIVKQIGTESGGNPNPGSGDGGAASGLLQFHQGTFNANNILGGAYTDPASQIAAAIPYVVNKYGMNPDGSPKGIGMGHGFAGGGYPSGLAWLSRGEYRTNPQAVRHYGPGLFTALNNMSVPKGFANGGFPHGIPRFEDGGFNIHQPLAGLPIPNPVPQQPQAPGPLPLGQISPAAPSTGGAPGPGATAPAPDPGALPQVADALSGIGLPGVQAGGGGGGLPQPGAEGTKEADPRGTLGAAPASQNHTAPAISSAIQNAAGTIGGWAAMAAQAAITAGAAGGTMGAGAPGGAAAGAMAAQGIQAGAQMAGQIATGAVNILSSLLVGSATGGSTGSASGVPLLPQRAPMQSGVPAINQRVYNGGIHVTNLDEFRRTTERMDAQAAMPHINKF